MNGTALIGTFYKLKEYALREAEKKNRTRGESCFSVAEFADGYLVFSDKQLKNPTKENLYSRV